MSFHLVYSLLLLQFVLGYAPFEHKITGEFQQWILNPEYSSINFIEGLPDMISLDPTKVNLLIIDDLMHEMNEVLA